MPFLFAGLLVGITVLSCGNAQRDIDSAPPAAPPPAAPVQPAEPAAPAATPDPLPPATTQPPVTRESAGPPATPRETAPAAPAESQDEGARILKRASAAYERLRTLKADFVMSTENRLLRSRTVSRGTLYQKSPDRLLLRFTDPPGDIIVSDGTYFWTYYPSVNDKQVVRQAADRAAGGGVDLRAQFIGDPARRFQYSVQGRESVDGRAADVMVLVPREDMGYKQLKVWIDAQDGYVRQFEITEENTLRRIVLSGLQLNPAMADDLFRFTPPAGARIVNPGRGES
jgi:chaperone LolA